MAAAVKKISLLTFILALFIQLPLLGIDPPAAKSPPAPNSTDELPKPAPPTKEMIESYIHGLSRGNNAFAFELYHQLKKSSENLCFSPYSITSALALPFAGSQGPTQESFGIVMHYLPKPDQVNQAYGILDKLYTTPWYLGPNECRLFFANSLWLQRDIKVLPDFLEVISKYYRSPIKFIDFMRNPEGARININEWVREKTQGRIFQELQGEDLQADIRMLVISAAFLKAVWAIPFDPKVTKETSFFVDPFTTRSVFMMTTSGHFRVFRSDSFTLIELPYRPSYQGFPTLSMMILLPNSNFGLAQLEQKFYLDQWESWQANLREEAIIVSVPKFVMHQSFDLSPLLKVMGLSRAFNPDQADFSGISKSGNLNLSKVIHESYLSIDEKGSDAISASPIQLGPSQTELGPALIPLNHPFLFLIVDTTNNTILLMGRLENPI